MILRFFVFFICSEIFRYSNDFGDSFRFNEEYFGDVIMSMLTLFQLMTLDSWTGFARPLMVTCLQLLTDEAPHRDKISLQASMTKRNHPFFSSPQKMRKKNKKIGDLKQQATAAQLTEEIQVWTGAFFILFIAVAVFVMLNLVTAVIVENAFSDSKSEEKELAVRLEREKEEELEDLKQFFLQIDSWHFFFFWHL